MTLRASHLKHCCRLSWCIGFLVGDKGRCAGVQNATSYSQTHSARAKWKLFKLAFSEVWKIICQVKEAFLSRRCFFWGVGYHCSLSLEIPKRDKVHQVITPPLPLPHSRHSLSVSALVLGSLGCSGLSGKLLHQTRVSSTGCLTVWLLQSCPAILQKPQSQPLWRALMKSMAWAPLLLILLVRSHTWLSKRQVESQIRRWEGWEDLREKRAGWGKTMVM